MGQDLADQILTRQGPVCLIPGCGDPWSEKAHIVPSGMGGRPSTYTAENQVGLCKLHHDIFDGRILQGRQRLLRVLMKHLADTVADDRETLHA